MAIAVFATSGSLALLLLLMGAGFALRQWRPRLFEMVAPARPPRPLGSDDLLGAASLEMMYGGARSIQ